MLSIDEAIAHAREVAKRNRLLLDSDELVQKSYDAYFNKLECEKCAEEHEQIAKWLEELKVIKSDGFTDDLLNMGFTKGYRKALDDFVDACKENILCKTFGLRECDIEKIEEQLKAGV